MSNPTMADKLRTAADIIDAHPELPTPVIFAYSTSAVELTWQVLNNRDDRSHEAQKRNTQAIIRALGGRWDKERDTEQLSLRRAEDIGGVKVGIIVARDAVCERVVVDTTEVTREVPAQPAVEARTVTEVVEQVEWRCTPLLAEQVSA